MINAIKCKLNKHQWIDTWDWGRHAPKRECTGCERKEVQLLLPSANQYGISMKRRWVEWTSLEKSIN